MGGLPQEDVVYMATHKNGHTRRVKSGPRQFVVVLTPEKRGWYSVTCPSLPGCHSQGRGISQALKNIREAIGLVLADMDDHGEKLPAADALLTTVRL